ncbi:unnamed protein product, partial [Linum tenue]
GREKPSPAPSNCIVSEVFRIFGCGLRFPLAPTNQTNQPLRGNKKEPEDRSTG